MALSKTHALVTALAQLRRYGRVDLDQVVYALIPDAIRCYGLPRPVTHFEVHPKTGVASAMVFPNIQELKKLTDENVRDLIKHEEKDYQQVAVGDTTNIGAFVATNFGRLPKYEFNGIFIHLLQDTIYDDYIRQLIDISRGRTEGKFVYVLTGDEYDAKAVRGLISQIEQQEYRILVQLFESEAGITADEFIMDQVFPQIRMLFAEKMAETTIKYINLDDDGTIVVYDDLCKSIVDNMVCATMEVL